MGGCQIELGEEVHISDSCMQHRQPDQPETLPLSPASSPDDITLVHLFSPAAATLPVIVHLHRCDIMSTLYACRVVGRHPIAAYKQVSEHAVLLLYCKLLVVGPGGPGTCCSNAVCN